MCVLIIVESSALRAMLAYSRPVTNVKRLYEIFLLIAVALRMFIFSLVISLNFG